MIVPDSVHGQILRPISFALFTFSSGRNFNQASQATYETDKTRPNVKSRKFSASDSGIVTSSFDPFR